MNPSHWEVPWPKDVDEIEYFVPMLCNIFWPRYFLAYVGGVAPNIGVFIRVFRVQNVITCKARLLGCHQKKGEMFFACVNL
jgi:hypothetical protein